MRGKNASLREMIRSLGDAGVPVPDGFATAAPAYRELVEANQLDGRIRDLLHDRRTGARSRADTGAAIRELSRQADLPEGVAEANREPSRRYEENDADVAWTGTPPGSPACPTTGVPR